jgi:hypothetical protein
MTVSFGWEISALDLSKEMESYPDLVITVHWRLRATDDVDELTAEVYGADSLQPPAEGAQFIPFSELTQELVVSWLEQKMEQEEMDEMSRLDHLKSILVTKIEQDRQPKVVTSKPPWQS